MLVLNLNKVHFTACMLRCPKNGWISGNSVDPDQTPVLGYLIWAYTVCLGLFVPILRVILVCILGYLEMCILCIKLFRPSSVSASDTIIFLLT